MLLILGVQGYSNISPILQSDEDITNNELNITDPSIVQDGSEVQDLLSIFKIQEPKHFIDTLLDYLSTTEKVIEPQICVYEIDVCHHKYCFQTQSHMTDEGLPWYSSDRPDHSLILSHNMTDEEDEAETIDLLESCKFRSEAAFRADQRTCGIYLPKRLYGLNRDIKCYWSEYKF